MQKDFEALLGLIDGHGPRSEEVRRFVLEAIRRDPEFESLALMAIYACETLGRLRGAQEDDAS